MYSWFSLFTWKKLTFAIQLLVNSNVLLPPAAKRLELILAVFTLNLFEVCVSSLEWNVELKKCIAFNEGSAHDIRAVRGKAIAARTARDWDFKTFKKRNSDFKGALFWLPTRARQRNQLLHHITGGMLVWTPLPHIYIYIYIGSCSPLGIKGLGALDPQTKLAEGQEESELAASKAENRDASQFSLQRDSGPGHQVPSLPKGVYTRSILHSVLTETVQNWRVCSLSWLSGLFAPNSATDGLFWLGSADRRSWQTGGTANHQRILYS